MEKPEIVLMYGSKLAEYVIGIGYLIAFVFFWKYVNGKTKRK